MADKNHPMPAGACAPPMNWPKGTPHKMNGKK